MKHILAYCDHLIERGSYKQAIALLQTIDDPLANERIYEIGQQSKINGRARKVIVQALIDMQTERANQLLIDHHLDFAIASYSMIVNLPKTGDARVADALIERLSKMLDNQTQWRAGIFVAIINALGEFRLANAIPILKQVLDTYPLTYETLAANITSYAHHAYTALRKIDDPSTNDLLDAWYDNFVETVREHIRQETILLQSESRFRISWYLQHHPDMIDYIVRKFNHGDEDTKQQLLRGVMLRMARTNLPDDQRDQLAHAILDYIKTLDDEKERKKLIQRIHYIDSPVIINYMEELFFTDELPTLAVQVFLARQHQTPEIIDHMINIIETTQILGFGLGIYMDYLVMVDRPETDAVIVNYAQRDPSEINVRLASNSLGKIAHRNETAFQILSQAIDSRHKALSDAAVYSLGTVGMRALPILISLLEPSDNRIRGAVAALGKPEFAPAIPHLITLLVSGRFPLTQNVIRTLKAIGTDEAFAAINAWMQTTNRDK